MTEHNTPQSNTRVRAYFGDDLAPFSGFHQGTPSPVGDECFTLYVDAPQVEGPCLVLTPRAVIALANELDKLRDDAQDLLDAEAAAEGRAVA